MLRNTTSIDGGLLRRMVEFAAPPGLRRDFRIIVANVDPCRVDRFACYGRAHVRGSRPWVLVEVADRDAIVPAAPTAPYLRKPPMARHEAALLVLAHEMRHLWQWRNGRNLDERDADAYALQVLRRWRREW